MALKVDNLHISTKEGKKVLENISFSLNIGEVIGVTGRSGAGKSTLIKALLGMTSSNLIQKGKITVDNIEMGDISRKKQRQLCGSILGFIPQLPMTAFDPRIKIRTQLIETYKYKLDISTSECENLAKDTLRKVNLTDVERILNSKPSELSGGMLQRIAFSYLLGLSPKYILADEPTAALDKDNGNLIVKLLNSIRENTGALFISHDIAALKKLCDRIIILDNDGCEYYNSFSELETEPQGIWSDEFIKKHHTYGKEEFLWKELR